MSNLEAGKTNMEEVTSKNDFGQKAKAAFISGTKVVWKYTKKGAKIAARETKDFLSYVSKYQRPSKLVTAAT